MAMLVSVGAMPWSPFWDRGFLGASRSQEACGCLKKTKITHIICLVARGVRLGTNRILHPQFFLSPSLILRVHSSTKKPSINWRVGAVFGQFPPDPQPFSVQSVRIRARLRIHRRKG